MNNIILRNFRLSNTNNSLKSLARYRTNPTTYPSPYNKPMNPWDNMDPGRKDKSVVDEFDHIATKLQPGQEAPVAWKATREFPEYYRPYLLNYRGHGYLIVVFAFFSYCYYVQREQIMKIKGRRVLKDYSHEKKIVYSPFINWRLNDELKTNPDPLDPLLKYLRRYIKESGF